MKQADLFKFKVQVNTRCSQLFNLFVVISVLLSLLSCSTSRYSLEQDVGPTGEFDALSVPNPTPKWEPLSHKGNKSPYVVRGKRYKLLKQAKGYQEEGIASWYGLKFHGELTSNGEVYNMYALTAAHKTLPLPAYLRVTNLENDKSIVVRVNDRGPFHEGRIIDLSYAAAKKLGYENKGTAKVKLEAIVLEATSELGSLEKGQDRLAYFIQIAAFSKESAALLLKQRVSSVLRASVLSESVFVAKSPNASPPVFRVRVGPFNSEAEATKATTLLKQAKIGEPIVISRAVNGSSW